MEPSRAAQTSRERIRLGQFSLEVATEFGPRLTALSLEDGPNLLAELGPDIRIRNPIVGDFHFRGGHRLWVAPEIPEISHVPDEGACDVTFDGDTIVVTSGEDRAGFSRTLTVTAPGDEIIVDHTVAWAGPAEIEVSPWAITQFPTGGIAILPLPTHEGTTGLRPDRSLVLWPYTRLDDPRITLTGEALLLDAQPGKPIKLGAAPQPGRLGYLRAGFLFSKAFATVAQSSYTDRGAVGQVFANQDFCELESLGPLTRMKPRTVIAHRETWHVTWCSDIETAIELILGEAAS